MPDLLIPLRWSDMDAFGHVNNVEYLRLLEDARVRGFGDWFGRDGGMLSTGVVIAHAEIDYVSVMSYNYHPAHVVMWVSRISAASFDMAYEVYAPTEEGDRGHLCARAETTIVPVELPEGRARRLTDEEREILSSHAGDPVAFRRSQRA